MNKIAIIPTRGGSKRIPNKNIKLFHGKPIIYYTIDEIIKSKTVDNIVVTSDSEKILSIVNDYRNNEKVTIKTFKVNNRMAGDNLSATDVLKYLICECPYIDASVKYILYAYAPSPFTLANDIINGLDNIYSKKIHASFPVTTFPAPILRSFVIETINDIGLLKMKWPEYEFTRSQDLGECYHDCGQWYWLNVKKFKEDNRFYQKKTMPVIIPRKRVQDLDTLEDWDRAKILYELLKVKNDE